jgi:hypothetical protein
MTKPKPTRVRGADGLGWCVVCQRGFEQQHGHQGGGRDASYCGGRCRQWWYRQGTPAMQRHLAAVSVRRQCPCCRAWFRVTSARQSRQMYCRRECHLIANGALTHGEHMSRVPWRECVACGFWFVGYYHRQNPRCGRCRAEATRALNRRKNTKRRGVAECEPYTLAEIAERDGHRCHLCHGLVDMKLTGAHRRGPTIDHLIPVTDSGPDTRVNVRLAHRSCNCARGAGGEVQLLLVG